MLIEWITIPKKLRMHTNYLKMSQKWMCDDCRKNYPTRIKAMLSEKLKV